MTDLLSISNGKYKQSNTIGGGAFSKIYNVSSTEDKTKKIIVKIHDDENKYDAVNEINVLKKIKKNRPKFKEELAKFKIKSKSKIITLKDYYIDDNNVYTIFKKYVCTIEDFNIKYNKFFNELLPIALIKKLSNSMFIALFELYISGFIHCDIKPDNIMISIIGYTNINTMFKDLKKKKISLDKFINSIDIKLIDFNKTLKMKSILKSTNIQTLYYTPPEIILGNRNYNYSVDLWATCCIIHELTTSLFLFDVFNLNNKNKLNYKEYIKKENTSNSSSNDEDSIMDYDYDENEDFEQLGLLHIYKNILNDTPIIFGKYINIYYSNGQLIGDISNNFSDKENTIQNGKIHNKIGNLIQLIYKDTKEKQFIDNILFIFNKVFIYNFNERLYIKDIISNYMF